MELLENIQEKKKASHPHWSLKEISTIFLVCNCQLFRYNDENNKLKLIYRISMEILSFSFSEIVNFVKYVKQI